MKKILLTALGLCSLLGYSQRKGDNEIKINLPYFIAGIPEITYERILDDNSALGLSAAFSLEKDIDMDTRWMLTPYYRMYFGRNKAKGFFIEADMAVINQNLYSTNNNVEYISGTMTNAGFGGAVGAKFLNKNGYIGEFYGGASRLFGLGDANVKNDYFPRIGICIGKRF